jgi:hypothetical protein
MAYGPPGTVHDPTKVMGRRIAAWIIDFIPALILLAVFSRHNVTYTNVGPNFCSGFRAVHSGYFCYGSGGTAYTGPDLQVGSLLACLVYYFAVAGVFQGATGATFGKHLVGLRVVDENGNLCTMGKALLRTLVGVFELGFCFVIGLVTASVTHPHRRIGDFVAGTYVVAKEAVGSPVGSAVTASPYPPPWTPPGWSSPPPATGQPWGTPTPWGTPPVSNPAPSQTPAPLAAPPTWGTPAASPPPSQTPATWGTPAVNPPAESPLPAASPSDEEPGSGAPTPAPQPEPAPLPAAEPLPAAAPQPGATAARREPQWDARRNAWVFWEVETSRWLQHDPVTGQWGPLR